MTVHNKPCEYCGQTLPVGVDKRTRQIRSAHFASCAKKPVYQRPVVQTTYNEDEIAQACMEAEISDSKFESLMIALASTSRPAPVEATITSKLGNIYLFTGDYSFKKGDKVYIYKTD